MWKILLSVNSSKRPSHVSFPGASGCFGALMFLLQFWQLIGNFHVSKQHVFLQCYGFSFLSRLSMYTCKLWPNISMCIFSVYCFANIDPKKLDFYILTTQLRYDTNQLTWTTDRKEKCTSEFSFWTLTQNDLGQHTFDALAADKQAIERLYSLILIIRNIEFSSDLRIVL